MPKTLSEIAIEAGLVNKTSAAKAGRMAEARKQPLVVIMIKELGVDEVALLGALRKQTRVPLIDPADIQIDPDALRQVPRDVCARLRVLPLSIATEGTVKILRVAMADPTDAQAIAELEQVTDGEIEVTALPLSAIDELVDKGYRQTHTTVVGRRSLGGTMFITSKGKLPTAELESEVSVTAQIPSTALQHAFGSDELDLRLTALIQVLTAKGLFSEADLAEAIQKLRNPAGTSS